MSATTNRSRPGRETIAVIAMAAVILQLGGPASVRAQETPATPAAATEEAPISIPPDELDSLVAPVALYSDPLLAQVLVAATYPLEIIQLQQWLGKNPGLEDDALAEAVAEQPWDPSIQSMAALPDLVTRLADDIQWVTELGNAFLTNQGDVMDAVQRMRAKAKDNGALESNEQQVVTTEVVETKTVIVVEPAEPEIIYVPSYSPVYVYGPPIYPYPRIYYPPYVAGAAFVAFSVGFIWGAARWGGSCCRCGWGRGNININVNNNFNRNVNRGGGNWQHNSNHRGGTPYSNKATANKYGGSARGDSMSSRQATARQQQAGAGNRSGGASASNRAAGSAGSRQGGASAGTSNRAAGSAGSRQGGASPSTSNRAAGSTGNRSGGASATTANRSGSATNRAGGGAPSASSNNIGSRNVPSSSSSRASGFGGSSAGYSGSNARAASSRGASSMGSRGGGSRGGGRRR